MTTDGFVGAVDSFPVGRIPNSDNMAVKAAAKPVPLAADGLVACSLMAGSTLSTMTHGTERICREFSEYEGLVRGRGHLQDIGGVYHRSGVSRVNSTATHCLTHSLLLASGITSFGLSGKYRASASQQRARA